MRVRQAKRGNATKIEHKMELLKEHIDELINIDPASTMAVLNFVERFADADTYTFNEAELLEQPYTPIRRIERIPRDTIAYTDDAADAVDDPAAKERLKRALASLRTH